MKKQLFKSLWSGLMIFLFVCCFKISVSNAQVASGTYTIQTKLVANKNLDVQGANKAQGTRIHLWGTNNGEAQRFIITPSNEAGYYLIKTEWGLCLGVGGSNPNPGAHVVTWECINNLDDQKWKFTNTGDGHYNIQSKLGTYIDVKNANTNDGAEIIMNTYFPANGNLAQRWKLQQVNNGSTKPVMTRFNPSVHGFKFANNFTVQTQIAGFNGPSFGGLCGGMVYSALDYFLANRAIPQQTYMPAEGMPLQSYIWNRQQQSAFGNADKWAEYGINPFGARNSEFFTWGIQLGSGRLGELISKIDRGEPVPLGLQACGNDCGCPGGCPGSHQVLAIGYHMGRYNGDQRTNIEDLSIFVYDPNFPNRTMTLKPNLSVAMYWYSEDTKCRWRAYFTDMKYSRSTPPVIANTPNEVIATFRTGGDDLRGGNDNVHLVLLLRSGATLRFDNVNGGKRWVDWSIQPVSRSLSSSFRAEDVVGVRLETTFNGGSGGDNWDIAELNVVVKTNGITKTIVNQKGIPLVRFTGDMRTKEFR